MSPVPVRASLPRVGIVGCGKIADSHIEQIRAIGRGEVVAVCDREILMAQQLSERWGVPASYTDMEEMLRVERLDVLHVATPPDSHLAIALMALAAGCHVFMEKPFALTTVQAQQMIDAAVQAGKRISVNYLYNFESPAIELREMLGSGKLGKVVHLQTEYGYNLAGDYGLAVLSDPGHWVHRLPGKLFHNVLDHVFAKVAPYVNDDFTVDAIAFRQRPDTGNPTVDAMADELRFMIVDSKGVTVSGSVSAHAKPVAHSMKVFGSKDTVELDYSARTLVRSARQSQPSAIGRLFPPWVQAGRFAANGWNNLNDFRRNRSHYFQCMRVLLEGFYDAVGGEGPDPVAHAEMLRVCRMIDKLVEATGKRA